MGSRGETRQKVGNPRFHGKFGEGGPLDHRSGSGRAGIDERSLRGDRNHLLRGAYTEHRFETLIIGNLQSDAFLLRGFKTLSGNRHLVGAWVQEPYAPQASGVTDSFLSEASVFCHDLDRRFGNDAAMLVSDAAF